MRQTRPESDSIGTLEVPAEAYYGVQTLRGMQNFHITGVPMDRRFYMNIVRIKKAAALTNRTAGLIDDRMCDALSLIHI